MSVIGINSVIQIEFKAKPPTLLRRLPTVAVATSGAGEGGEGETTTLF